LILCAVLKTFNKNISFVQVCVSCGAGSVCECPVFLQYWLLDVRLVLIYRKASTMMYVSL